VGCISIEIGRLDFDVEDAFFPARQFWQAKGVAGWVAQNHKPTLNGNPSVEPGYLNHSENASLHSVLAVPLERASGVAAVLALYRARQDASTKDDLQVVEAIAFRLGAVIEQAVTPKATGATAAS
jgi:GAF domain-containing protein